MDTKESSTIKTQKLINKPVMRKQNQINDCFSANPVLLHHSLVKLVIEMVLKHTKDLSKISDLIVRSSVMSRKNNEIYNG